MDVKTIFLNGELDEKIYMMQYVGFVEEGQKCKVCILQQFIYGLKQTSRQWYLKFNQVITSYEFMMIDEAHRVHVIVSGQYLLIGNDKKFIVSIKE